MAKFNWVRNFAVLCTLGDRKYGENLSGNEVCEVSFWSYKIRIDKFQSFVAVKWKKCPMLLIHIDKVRMYEEIMTNDDNLESNLLTSSLLKMTFGTS